MAKSKPKPQVKDPGHGCSEHRHAEMIRRHDAERGSRNLLAAIARLAFKEGIALRGMTPEEQLAAAKADGWQGRVIGATRWAGGAVPPVVRSRA